MVPRRRSSSRNASGRAPSEHCLERHSATTKTRRGCPWTPGRTRRAAGTRGSPSFRMSGWDDSLSPAAVRHRDPTWPCQRAAEAPRGGDRGISSLDRDGAAWPGAGRAGTRASPRHARRSISPGARLGCPGFGNAPTAGGATLPRPPGGDRSERRGGEVDRFLLAKRAECGVSSPASPTDDRTWLLGSFHVTGLPPTPEAVGFAEEDVSPEKRARAADGPPASPHYSWRSAGRGIGLDLVRHAESRGHDSDFPIANAWQYRHYLVRAFNADLPGPPLPFRARRRRPPSCVGPAPARTNPVLGTGWAFPGQEVLISQPIDRTKGQWWTTTVHVLTKTFLGLTVAYGATTTSSTWSAKRITTPLPGSSSDRATGRCGSRPSPNTPRDRRRPGSVARPASAGHRRRGGRGTGTGCPRDGRRPLTACAALPFPHRRPCCRVPRSALPALELASLTEPAGHPLQLFARLARDPEAMTGDRFRSVSRPDPPPTARRGRAAARSPGGGGFRRAGRTPWKADGPAFGPGPRGVGELMLGSSPEPMPWCA